MRFKPQNPYCLLAFVALLLSMALFGAQAHAATYYVATSGSDSNLGSSSSPWATFGRTMSSLKPGDTLIIKNGTYRNALNVTVSGTQTSPITIKAENDGGAIIDGGKSFRPCNINGRADLVIQGIKCQNSSGSALYLYNSSRVTLRRVSAHNAGSGNYHVFDLSKVSNSLLEDCAASGSGRVLYDILACNGVTLRRCWGRWVTHSGGGGPNEFIQVYGSNDTVVENCVGTKSSTSATVAGICVWAHTYNSSADRNKFYGNVAYNFSEWGYWVGSAQHRIYGNTFQDNVAINNSYGFAQRGDADMRVNRMTIIGSPSGYVLSELPSYSGYPKDSNYAMKGDVRNSILVSGGLSIQSSKYLTSFTNAYNDIYNYGSPYSGVVSKGVGDLSVNPGFNTTKYGKGGYLTVPAGSPVKKAGQNGGQMGAEVLYRYQNGTLTNVALWPWPMEDRIKNETGVSVTWESGGGLWKTLDGLYSASTPTGGSTTTTPPPASSDSGSTTTTPPPASSDSGSTTTTPPPASSDSGSTPATPPPTSSDSGSTPADSEASAPPELVSPADGQTVETTVTLVWKKSKGKKYLVYLSKNPSFTGATPIEVASLQDKGALYAGLGGYAAGLFLMGVVLSGGIRGRRRTLMLLVLVILSCVFLLSCGGGGGGLGSSALTYDEMAYTVSGLSGSSTYYWKVVADEGNGVFTESPVGSFNTL